ncbi:MAG: efflux RND transporter periplasmic adaptor subunit [Candidatus Cloacimonetes bacterium]|jgi:RND family efflux transporter MFP subunit|nr:efflux RND transporter periplasmic adaptor subunit [Candidatus Cloacimonadota bacterium]MBT4331931.1 efflux RND transporter periplasmic adaptor subunit [Candidatus Cloacimonadota bacterium]MBT4575477.1 efflux RND transporter periplasmic adaptor subunit [Candidatus Cloacimonadota bacterium]MBT5421275.1 efflux RND transporter periplasmic adaptor subunit [Candidatus Cloacimonadota bacterium]
MKKVFFITTLIISLIFISSCNVSNGKKDRSKFGGKAKNHQVELGTIVIKLEETGEIQPIREIEQKSQVSGELVKFHIEEGDFVNKGDLIAEIEPDYNQAEAILRVNSNLKLAEIELENAKEKYNKRKALFADNYISETELDNYKDTYSTAQINYDSALQQYELIKDIESADNLSKLYSTASGTIILKPVEEGEMVVSSSGSYSAGTVILKLADLSRMIVNTKINEVDISKIEVGMKVNIQVDAYPYETFDGSITKIAAMAINYNNVKVFPVEIELGEVDKRLKPGMTANITIIGEERKDIVVIPIRCIFSDDEGNDIVYKVVKDSIGAGIVVKTGINNFQQVEIIEGIAVGDTISTKEPESKIDDDLKIKFD